MSLMGSLFALAGVWKNSELNRWEFLEGQEQTSTNPTDTVWNRDDVPAPGLTNSLENVQASSVVPHSNTAPAESSQTMSKSKKKRERKKRSASITSISSQESGNAVKSVNWGTVDVVYLASTVSFDSIPSHGAYPLGLGVEIERCTYSIDVFFAAQQAQLLERAREKGVSVDVAIENLVENASLVSPQQELEESSAVSNRKTKKHGSGRAAKHQASKSRSGSLDIVSEEGLTPQQRQQQHQYQQQLLRQQQLKISEERLAAAVAAATESTGSVLESRQYDFKSKEQRNPLYCSLSEDERIARLMGNKEEWSRLTDSSLHHDNNNNINSSTGAASSDALQHLEEDYRNKGVQEVDYNNGHSHVNGQNHGHTHNHSHTHNHVHTHGHAHGHGHVAHHPLLDEVNLDVKAIKASRDQLQGCGCKPKKLDKLSNIKLKAELAAHGHLIDLHSEEEINQLSKKELGSRVKEVLSMCELCVASGCECFELGVPCSAQTCGCLKGGYRPGQQSQVCGNIAGREVFDQEKVAAYRRRILDQTKTKTEA